MSLLRHMLEPAHPKRFVLALGGGGGRGLAHLGVLEVLEEHGLRPSAIIGTSIGAMFGAMYAHTPDIHRVSDRVHGFLHSDAFINLGLPTAPGGDAADDTWLARLTTAARQSVLYAKAATDIALADVAVLSEIAATLCPARRFDELLIPFYATAVRYPSGDTRIFSDGELIPAITASMAIPGVFDPVAIEGERFVDGGLSSELPAREARAIARPGELVVAVNVGARPDPTLEPSHVLEMLDWAGRVKSSYLRRYQRTQADILVEPMVGYTQWHDFSHPRQEIERGRDAMLEMMPDLQSLLEQ